jgi:hypothetical protein
LDKANAAINAGIARPNIWTSSASSDQPPKHAQNVLRSREVISRYQLNMILILMSGTKGSRERTAPLQGQSGKTHRARAAAFETPLARRRQRISTL